MQQQPVVRIVNSPEAQDRNLDPRYKSYRGRFGYKTYRDVMERRLKEVSKQQQVRKL
jgi:hypothetical protein